MKLRPGPPCLALVLGLAWSLSMPAAEPTPTPQPKAKRKLGGGSFGQPTTSPTPGTGGGSGLADVARQAQEDPAGTNQRKPRGIVITNESLKKTASPAGSGTSITISGTSGSKPSVKLPPTPTPVADVTPEYRDASGRTEAEWRARASEVRSRAERAEAEVSAAQSEVRRLENDFYAWSDGNYRERVIRPAWDQAKEKLERLESELEKAHAELAGLEDEARKSGTPPGWLR